MAEEQWVSVSEAAKLYQLTTGYVRRLLIDQKIIGRKSGGIWLVLLSSLEEHQRRMKRLGKGKYGLRHNKST